MEIFFLMSGEAGFVVTKKRITVIYSKIPKGSLFGELDLFSKDGEANQIRRQFNAKAMSD